MDTARLGRGATAWSEAGSERENVFGEPTDLEKRARTAIALQTMKLMDSDAADQSPVPAKRRQVAVRVLKATGRVAGKGCLYGAKYAGKGALAATKWALSPSRSSRTVTVIISDEQECGMGDVVGAVILIVVVLGLAGLFAGA